MDAKGDSAHLDDMKATLFHAMGAIALTFTLAACASSVVPDIAVPGPMPSPTPVASASPAPPLVIAAPSYDNYMDAPQTPGTWRYFDEPGETLALFGQSSREPMLIVRCDKTSRKVGIARKTSVLGTVPMKVETETATRELTAQSLGDVGLTAAELDPRDPLLDSMAITKGRFAISTPREPTLYIPAWVEVSRVIEDCR